MFSAVHISWSFEGENLNLFFFKKPQADRNDFCIK